MIHETMLEKPQHRSFFSKAGNFVSAKRALIIEGISLLFVIIFLYTGIAKLREFFEFQISLELSPLSQFGPFIAYALPITEFIVSLLLFFPRTRLIGLYATTIMMAAFTIYVGYLLALNSELPCTCGGIFEQLSWPGHLIVNLILTGLAVWAIRLQKKHLALIRK